jgi:hypothetical protein
MHFRLSVFALSKLKLKVNIIDTNRPIFLKLGANIILVLFLDLHISAPFKFVINCTNLMDLLPSKNNSLNVCFLPCCDINDLNM